MRVYEGDCEGEEESECVWVWWVKLHIWEHEIAGVVSIIED